MKRVIYKPAVGEFVPEGAVFYNLPIAGAVVDVLAESVVTAGTLCYDSEGVPLAEPFIHHFSGWEG